MGGLIERAGLDGESYLFPGAPPRDQAGRLQHAEMLGDTLAADRQFGGEVGGGRVARDQESR